MKIVNKSNLPAIIFDYLAKDNYDYNDSLSATTLLKPTRQIILEKKYWDEIELDAADRLWSLFGTGIHKALEDSKLGESQEERIFAEVEGVKISGKFDIIYDGKLTDFKVTSAYTLVYGSRLEEWKKQLSIYRYLYNAKKGVELPVLAHIVAILRDWATRDAERVKNYPVSPVMLLDIECMSIGETANMIAVKVAGIKRWQEEYNKSGKLPNCTDEERWYNEAKDVYNKCQKYCPCFGHCEQANPILKTPKIQEGKLL